MNELSNRNREGSVEDHRQSVRDQDYFELDSDHEVRSEKGSSKNRYASSHSHWILRTRNKRYLYKSTLTERRAAEEEGEGLIETPRQRSNGRRSARDIEQAFSESSDPFQIDQLLQNFDADEFLVPPSPKEKLYLNLLSLRANLPMYTTTFLIYAVSIMYFFTYILPLTFPEYNESYHS